MICEKCYEKVEKSFELIQKIKNSEEIYFKPRRNESDNDESEYGSVISETESELVHEKNIHFESSKTDSESAERPEKFQCDFCGFSTSRKYILKVHIACWHFRARYSKRLIKNSTKCSAMKMFQVFTIENKEVKDEIHLKPLKTYLQKIDPDKVLKCQNCESYFSSKKDLLNHTKSLHEKIRRFFCDLCHYSFYRKDHLKRHLLSHIRNKKIITPCKVIQIKRSNGTLDSNRPLRCSINNCGLYFQRYSHLLRHEGVHND